MTQAISAAPLSTKKVIFQKAQSTSFHKDITTRVDAFFKDNHLSKKANAKMKLKTGLILTGWIGTYALIIADVLLPWQMLTLAAMHGFFTAMVGVNIGHDAIHGSYSKNRKTNHRLGLLFNFIGANDYIWNIMHNIVHHTYTNIPGHDGDINQVGALRMEPTQKLKWYHRFQFVYAFILYLFGSLLWVFIKDYKKFFSHYLGAHYRETFPRKEIVRLFMYKVFYYTVFIATPLIVIDLEWYFILLGFVVAHAVEGFSLGIIFMLGHIIEGTSYPEKDEENKIEMPWANFQMRTSANFAINNPVANYLCGGLNFQIEHHLFPKICHIHYPKIAPIVKQTAMDHDLPYIEHKTFLGALASHIRVLKKFGREE